MAARLRRHMLQLVIVSAVLTSLGTCELDEEASCATYVAVAEEAAVVDSLTQAHQTVAKGMYGLDAYVDESLDQLDKALEETRERRVQAELAANIHDISVLLEHDSFLYETIMRNASTNATDVHRAPVGLGEVKLMAKSNSSAGSTLVSSLTNALESVIDSYSPDRPTLPFLDQLDLTLPQSIGLAAGFTIVLVGFCMLIASPIVLPSLDSDNMIFHLAIDAIICINAVVICVELHNGESDFTVIAENVFNSIFLFELCVRIQDVEFKKFIRDPWGWFDTLLVAAGSWDLWIMPIVETGLQGDESLTQNQTLKQVVGIFRVLRLLRLIRLMRPKPKPPPWSIDKDFPAEAWYSGTLGTQFPKSGKGKGKGKSLLTQAASQASAVSLAPSSSAAALTSPSAKTMASPR